ncbi:hypothetical protein Q1695_006592 [Nippostrongylus brasiliensis]|nr:hypothetical protein Q1695_006592 [Nippostrongylus brasiliensis]
MLRVNVMTAYFGLMMCLFTCCCASPAILGTNSKPCSLGRCYCIYLRLISDKSKQRSDMSSPGADDVCPICLCSMNEGFSRPESCKHRFDLDCLTEWAKLRLSCPSCRAEFSSVYTYKMVEGKPALQKVEKMEPPAEAEPFEESNPLDFTFCEICSGGMHEDLLLICDHCDRGFHTYCLTPPLDGVPSSEQWFCPQCEQSRMSQPSTSRQEELSARTIRLVQRTALAERVRRRLARNRRIEESYETTTTEEEDEEEEENNEEDRDSASSVEETVGDFQEDDARVLDLAEMRFDGDSLPSIQRRRRKRGETKKGSKSKVKKRRTVKKKGGRRKHKRSPVKRKSAGSSAAEGPMDMFVMRRGVSRGPIARLSLLGAGLEPVADDDSLVTENSRRFDRPIARQNRTVDTAVSPEGVPAKSQPEPADSCDLLGSIIPEQMKTLAPGRLFAVRGGRFNTTEDFEKYKDRKTMQLSSELKQRLGLPTASTEERSEGSNITDVSKKKNNQSAEKRSPNRAIVSSCSAGISQEEKKNTVVNRQDGSHCQESNRHERPSSSSSFGQVRERKSSERLAPSSKDHLRASGSSTGRAADRHGSSQNSAPHSEKRDLVSNERRSVDRKSTSGRSVDRVSAGPSSSFTSDAVQHHHSRKVDSVTATEVDKNRTHHRRRHSRDDKEPHNNNVMRNNSKLQSCCEKTHRSNHPSNHHRARAERSEKLARLETSECEEPVDKRAQSSSKTEGTSCGTDNSWMPNLSSSKSVSNEASSSINDVLPAAEGKNGEKLDGNELLATIDGLAKTAIRPFKKRLSVEEYKNVMRAVVRECYKKRILDEKTISSKVRKYVDALKNGEQLPSGHHVPKRSDGDDTYLISWLQMSSSTSDFKSVSETLQVSNMQDDSLCTDEFEIINCDTMNNGSCERNDDTMSQWSTKHSINVESTIPMNDLSHLLCSTHSEIPSVVSRTLRQSSKGCTTSPGNSTAEPDALKETPILAGTVKSPSSSMNTMADMLSLDSDATLENVIRSQSETREMLEKAIMSLDTMNKERSQITSRFASISSLEEEIAILKNRIAVIEQENADLKRMNANGGQVSAPVRKLNECEVAEHKEIEQKLKDLQQQAASGEKDLADVTDQLETALRKIADLTESHNSATVKCGTLSDKLSETYAMLLSEKERVAVLEDEIRSLRAAGGEGFNLPLINEQMVVREMQEKEAYAEKLKLELEETRKLLNEQMECCDKKENELRTHVEIINVLKEEDTEGRREIAEKDRKIAELEEMVRFMRLNRAEITSVVPTTSTSEEENANLKNRIAILEKENAELKRRNAYMKMIAPVQKAIECTIGDHSVLQQKIDELQEKLFHKSYEAALLEQWNDDITSQLEEANRKVADQSESHDSLAATCGALSDKLSETYAELLSEKERVSVLEDKIRSLLSAGGGVSNMSSPSKRVVVTEMQRNAAYKEADSERRQQTAESSSKVIELEQLFSLMQLNRSNVDGC